MPSSAGQFHLLLIGVDRYDSEALTSLKGCVNDIDAVEKVFTDEPGFGFDGPIRVIRLASSNDVGQGRGATAVTERGATRAVILDALEELASEVGPNDRVHVHYSGHGHQYAWTDADGVETGVWSEGLLTSDGDWVTDVELNAWLNAIGEKVADLTVVLDCCNSSGVSRGAEAPSPETASRGGAGASNLPAPGEGGLRLPGSAGAAPLAAGGLRRPDDRYVVLAACLSHEEAQEKVVGRRRHGMLTYSFVETLSSIQSAEERQSLRWADVWPDLLEKAAAAADEAPKVPSQRPWLIGRPERRVFGGPWTAQDLGFGIRAGAEGEYHVRAGTLMGITEGAELAVYGPEPARLPEIGSAEEKDARVGVVVVESAERTGSVARSQDDAFALPPGARARLIKAVVAERLRVFMESPEPEVAKELRKSKQLRILSTKRSDTEVSVSGDSQKGWTIGDDVDPKVATCPAPETADDLQVVARALRAGLEHYARYNQVLRLAETCVDVELQGSLAVKFLKVDPEEAKKAPTLGGTEFAKWLEGLPELDKRDGVYFVEDRATYLAWVENLSDHKLRVFLFCCAAGGQAQYLDDMELRETFVDEDGTRLPGERNVFWWTGKMGEAFSAEPTGSGPETVDQFVVAGTTNLKAELESMGTKKSVQEVVNAALPKRGTRGAGGASVPRDEDAPENPDLWTATVVPMIVRGG